MSTRLRFIFSMAISGAIALAFAGCERKPDPPPQPTSPAEPPIAVTVTVAMNEPPMPARIDALDALAAASIRKVAQAVRENPNSSATWLDLGMVYHARDMYVLAETCYTQVLERSGDHERALYYRAIIRYEMGNVDGALDDLERDAGLDPTYAPIQWQRGFIQLGTGDVDAAEESFRLAIEIDPADATGWLGLARVHLARGDLVEATDVLEKIIQMESPNVGYARRLLAGAYQRLGRKDDARVALKGASNTGLLKVDPWSNQLMRFRVSFSDRLELANMLMTDGRVDISIRILKQLLDIEPDHVTAVANLGAAYFVKQEYDACIKQSNAALALDSDWWLAHQNLAASYAAKSRLATGAEREEFAALAMTHVDRAIELNPSYSRALLTKALLLTRASRTGEAIEWYKRASVAEEHRADWLYEAAKLEWRAQRWDDAIDSLRSVLKSLPELGEAHYLLGAALMNAGQLNEAERELKRALELLPDNTTVNEALRSLQAQKGASRLQDSGD